jgi:hypothetical protein
MNATQRRSPLHRQLEAYEESWKSDHLAAQDCRDWEELIAVGIAAGESLERVNRNWREGVFRGTYAFDAGDERELRDLHLLWLTITQGLCARATALEQAFGAVAGFAELRDVATRIAKQLASWTAPKLASAVGSRDQQLSREDAANLDALLTKPSPPPTRQFKEMESSFLQ